MTYFYRGEKMTRSEKAARLAAAVAALESVLATARLGALTRADLETTLAAERANLTEIRRAHG